MWNRVEKSFQLGDVQVYDVWMQLANEIGAMYIPTEDDDLVKQSPFSTTVRSTNYGAVVHRVKGWTITLDSYRTIRDDRYKSSGKITVFMSAPLSNREGHRLSIYPKNLFRSAGKFFGMQDIEVRDPEFDSEYIIKGTDEAMVRALLASERIQQLMRSSKEINLSIREGEEDGRSTLMGMRDQLYWSRRGWGSVTKDLRLLKTLFELFEETLNRLHAIGCIGDT
jgi:hypothetical protein